MVMVERNVYFDKSAAVDHLEGEDLVIVEAPPATPAPLLTTANCATPTPVVPVVCPPPPPPPDDPSCQLCIQEQRASIFRTLCVA